MFSDFMVTDLAVHQIHRRLRDEAVEPLLSTALSPLSRKGRQFIETKFLGALGDSQEIRPMDDPPSEVPSKVTAHLSGGLDLLDLSWDLAHHLQSTQTGSASEGLLLVGDVTYDNRRGLVIAKMEYQSGARADFQGPQDHVVIQVELLDNLFLTDKSQVFKIACFEDGAASFPDLRGRLRDNQHLGLGSAGYFLHEYLGCEYALAARTTTERFYKSATKYIARLESADDRAWATIGLVGEMRSRRATLSVRDFATRYLPDEDWDGFVDYMSTEGVAAESQKDTSLIAGKLASVQIEFENGALLFGSPADMDENGSIVLSATGAEVKSRVQKVTAAGRHLRGVD